MTLTDGEPEQNIVPAEPLAPPTLAGRLKAVRDAWKWSQEEMAEVLRVDQASISFWERGKIKPSGSALMALAALFRTTVDALEKGDGFVMPAAPSRGAAPKGLRPPPRTVCLPVAEPGRVTIIDLGTGYLSAQHPGEVVVDLGRFTKDNRRIWIVVE